jgi:hypothetical protein
MAAMRLNTHSLYLGSLFLLVGCGAYGAASGQTYAKYSGTVPLVFTNATPQTMCELHMSADVDPKFGDNWLPKGGLASGQSVEFKVQAGTYKATWNTCKKASDKLYYAGTLIGDTAFVVNDQTQLFTYVADNVPPTKRAPPRDFYTMVKFSGQPIGGPPDAAPPPPPEAEPAPAAHDAVAKADPKAKKGAKPVKATPAASDKLDARDLIDRKARIGKKKPIKPSVGRGHDLADSKVTYGQK